MSIGESSKGKTADFDSVNEGSTPSSPTKRNYHMEWYERNREARVKQIADRRKRKVREAREFIVAYLREHPCIVCGEDDIVVLEFDHVRDEKKLNLSFMVGSGYTIRTLETEIAK